MIIEELIGTLVSLGSILITPAPSIAREIRGYYWSIFDESPEDELEISTGLIHREYEPAKPEEIPYYETLEVPILLNYETHRNPCESLRRSFLANIGLLMATVILGFITIALVYVDLNTTNSCIEWRHFNYTTPSSVRVLQTIGISLTALPLFVWFPVTAIMLWGWGEFKKNYLSCLYACVVTSVITMAYRAVFFDKYDSTTEYRLPGNVMFVFTICLSIYLAARKFKQVNPTTNCSHAQIFFYLAFTFMACTVVSYLYTYVIIEYFKATKHKIKKAMIAAATPGIAFFPTAIGKYLVLRRSAELIPADKAFVMCYFLRGGAIGLYRTMQSDFQNIWLFIGLSLLHGVSNIFSKSTLGVRIKIWKCFIGCVNNTRCGSALEVLPTDTARIRRFNADLEIQNILFEYTTIILSQAYLVLYLVMNFDMEPWEVIRSALIRICISFAIDFIFNIISVFIQLHFYDIPMRGVWFKYWRRHVIANAVIIVCMVSYFGEPLVSVFEARENRLLQYNELRNCTLPL